MTVKEIEGLLSKLREEYKQSSPEKRESIKFKAIPLQILLNKKRLEQKFDKR